jgi:trehalose 6-phosphate phosphatase
MPDYLFNKTPLLKRKILQADSVVLFLDYDGTIADFNNDAMKAVPNRGIIRLLEKTLKNPRIHIFIITGRLPEHIKPLIPLKGMRFICSHGFIMDFVDLKMDIPREDKVTINRMYEDVRKEFSDRISDINKKGDIGINFNYRGYGDNEDEIKKQFIEIVKKHDTTGRFRIIELSKCFNVMPRIWDKGKAVNYVLKNINNGLPLYFGDDTTDEFAFEVLRNRGITVYVKNNDVRKTNAQFYVNNPREVIQALRELFN